jgi:hypothetical protein
VPPLCKVDWENREEKFTFSTSQGKIRINFRGWEETKVIRPGEMLTIRLGPQVLEGIGPRHQTNTIGSGANIRYVIRCVRLLMGRTNSLVI